MAFVVLVDVIARRAHDIHLFNTPAVPSYESQCSVHSQKFENFNFLKVVKSLNDILIDFKSFKA